MAGEGTARVRREREPKQVGLRALGLGGDSGSVKVKDAYVAGAKLLFNVPKYSGMGAHWSLDEDEASDLGEAIAAFVKTLPASQRKKWEKKLEKYWPGINLIVVAGMITVPRAMVTAELMRMKRSPSPSPDENANTFAGPTHHDVRDVVERHSAGPAESHTADGSASVG